MSYMWVEGRNRQANVQEEAVSNISPVLFQCGVAAKGSEGR